MTDLRSGSADRRASSAIRAPRPPGVRLSPFQRLGATGGIALIVLLIGLLAVDGIARTRDARTVVVDTHKVIEATQATLQDVTNAETGQRGFLLTNDERYLGPYHAALLALTADTVLLRALTAGDRLQRQQLDSLSRRIDYKLAELAETIKLKRTLPDSALALVRSNRGKNAMDDIRATLRSLASRQEMLLAERTAAADNHYKLVEAIVIGGTIAAVLIALLLNTLLTRFADSQADAVRRLDAQNSELSDANQLLADQSIELELQNKQLQEQAVELETQQVQLEERATELEVQTTHAEEANRAKSLFLTTMSHELRTPLNAIGGYVDLLAMEIRGPLVEAQREDLRRIKKSGQHLLSLINDILNLAKIESGQLDLDIRDVSLAAVFENVDALVAPQFDAKRITYTYPRCDPSLRVRADSEKMQQILLNVLSNACKFTEAHGSVTVECDAAVPAATNGENTISISIRDTGRGIETDKLEEIFEPFVQIDRHLTGVSQQGVGLGLAISRHLARSMSGELVATSDAGVGTTFVLTMPRGTRALAAPSPAQPARGTSGPTSAS